MAKLKTNIVSGIITGIEPVHKNLSFINLKVIGVEGQISASVPFYSHLEEEYVGRNIDFQTIETGRFLKTIDQKVIGSNFEIGVTLPKSLINEINKNYREVVQV